MATKLDKNFGLGNSYKNVKLVKSGIKKSDSNTEKIIEQAIQADKDIISKIVVEYDEDSDITTYTFPKGVAMLSITLNTHTLFLKGYELVDKNGQTIEGYVLEDYFTEGEYLCLQITGDLTEQVINSFVYYPFSHNLTSDEINYNTYNLYNSNKFELITDKDNHLRFVEGEGTMQVREGITPVYVKWSLSGSHLLLVTSGTANDEAVIPNAFIFGSFVLPEWIYNKIYPVFLVSYLEARSDILIADDTSTQTIRIALKKDTDNKILIVLFDSNQTLTKDRAFRFQFDLLIDND